MLDSDKALKTVWHKSFKHIESFGIDFVTPFLLVVLRHFYLKFHQLEVAPAIFVCEVVCLFE